MKPESRWPIAVRASRAGAAVRRSSALLMTSGQRVGDAGCDRRRHLGYPGIDLARRDLEADEAVDDVEERAEEYEEAVGEVGGGRDAQHAGDVGAAGIPRDEDGRDGAGVLDGAGEHLRG